MSCPLKNAWTRVATQAVGKARYVGGQKPVCGNGVEGGEQSCRGQHVVVIDQQESRARRGPILVEPLDRGLHDAGAGVFLARRSRR